MSSSTHKFKIGNILSSECYARNANIAEGFHSCKPEAFFIHLLKSITQKALCEHLCKLSYKERMITNVRCKYDVQNGDSDHLCFHLYSLPETNERFPQALLEKPTAKAPMLSYDKPWSITGWPAIL